MVWIITSVRFDFMHYLLLINGAIEERTRVGATERTAASKLSRSIHQLLEFLPQYNEPLFRKMGSWKMGALQETILNPSIPLSTPITSILTAFDAHCLSLYTIANLINQMMVARESPQDDIAAAECMAFRLCQVFAGYDRSNSDDLDIAMELSNLIFAGIVLKKSHHPQRKEPHFVLVLTLF